MSKTKVVRASPSGDLPGVRVIGFHGRVNPRLTPTRQGPVYVAANGHLLRIVEVRPGADGATHDVQVETVGPALPADADLPGVGTRVGPWAGRLGDVIVVLGESERAQAHRLTKRRSRDEPPRVERFVRWLKMTGAPDKELTCQRLGQEVAWYCSREEAFALWERLQPVVREEFFAAIRTSDSELIEKACFWLSRVMLTPDDLYLAAAGLRQIASPHWKVLLREGLRQRDPQSWEAGLEEAKRILAAPPPVLPSVIGPGLSGTRTRVRGRFMIPRAAA